MSTLFKPRARQFRMNQYFVPNRLKRNQFGPDVSQDTGGSEPADQRGQHRNELAPWAAGEEPEGISNNRNHGDERHEGTEGLPMIPANLIVASRGKTTPQYAITATHG
jgi:hypothetical protein